MVEDDDSALTKEDREETHATVRIFNGDIDLGSITFLTRTSRCFAELVGPPELLVDIMVQVRRC